MSKYSLAHLVWMLVLLPILSFAQQYRFHNIGVEDGLSQSQVLTIYQDGFGEIWIGTANGGITIFDGQEFRYLSQKDGIPSNTIYNVAALSNGEYAISTLAGLAIGHEGNFRNYNTSDGLQDELTYCTLQSRSGEVWIGTAKGVCNYKDGEIQTGRLPQLDDKAVYRIQEDDKGVIWFSTMGDGLYKYASGKLTHIGLANGLPGLNVNGVFTTKSHTLVFTYDGLGVVEQDSVRPYLVGHQLNGDVVFDAVSDKFGGVWFATKKGLFYQGEKSRYYRKENGLGGEMMGCLLRDFEGNIWAGSRESGIVKVNRNAFENFNASKGLPSNSVNRILGRKDSSVWVATDNGIAEISEGGEISIIGKRYALQTRSIRCIYEYSDNEIYLGTNKGAYLWENNRLKKIYNPASVQYYVQDITTYHDTIIVATNLGLAYVYKNRLRKFELSGFPEVLVNDLLVDQQGKLWVGTNEQGLWRVDNFSAAQVAELEGFKARTVKDLYEDSEGKIWCASNSGLYYYDKGRFNLLTEENGLSSNSVVSIIESGEGTYWVGLNKGANRIIFENGEIKEVEIFGKEDGFNGQESNPRAIDQDETGKIWFGTNGGVNVYSPENDTEIEQAPITRIFNVRLFMQETEWKDYAEKIGANGLPIELELPYDKNNLSFQFKGVSHVNADLVRYRYRLVGEDTDWIETTQRRADYSNLNHGFYTFEVMAGNSDGVWNKETSTFSFTILPPFWRTWWFYGILLLIVIAAVFSYFKIRNANKQITQINEILVEQKDIISKKNKDIMDSIKYAKRIQDAVLPAPDEIDLPKTFIFNRPKDVVSGDFYWFRNNGKFSLFAVADCTGHGVPGAFMSIIGHNTLNKIANEEGLTEPDKILSRLNMEISNTLNRRQEEGPIRDGLDISLCSFNRETEELEFAGAHHTLLIWRMGELKVIKGDRIPIGNGKDDTTYTKHKIQLLKGDMIYLYTDGFVDQFGGEAGKKYKTVRFRSLLVKMGKLPISEQRNMLIREFETWKQNEEQVDDVLVLGTLL